MSGVGAFSEGFDLGLGDLMELEDGGGDETTAPQAKAKAKKSDPFPSIEGEEPLQEFVSKYKKACLNRKGVFRDLHEKWQTLQGQTGQTGKNLGSIKSHLVFSSDLLSGNVFWLHPREEWAALEETNRNSTLNLFFYFLKWPKSIRRLFEGIGCGKVVLSGFPPSLTSLSFIAPSTRCLDEQLQGDLRQGAAG